MKRFAKAVFLVLLGGVIVAFAVANRHPVRFIVDPFINRDLALSVEAPFYLYLFIALFVGLVAGASVMWMTQGRWRRAAREERREAALWKREAENLKRGLQVVAASSTSNSSPRPLRSYF